MRLWLGVVIVACLGVYLVGNGRAALWDRDEPWYAQCSRQMLQTGDWVVPKYLDKLRTEKPPLIYWGHVLSMRVFGDTPFAARLVSTTGMTLVLLVSGVTLFRVIGAKRAVWTVFILGTSALAIVAAKMCLTDAVLLLWVTIAEFCIYAIYRGKGSWEVVLLMWLAVALGGLTKGPIALVGPAGTAIVLLVLEAPLLWRAIGPGPAATWRQFVLLLVACLAGLGILAAVVGPWLVLVHLKEPRWLPAVFGILDKHLTGVMEGHGGYPGYYLLLTLGTFFPWSLFLVPTAVMAWQNRKIPAIRFAIAAVLGPWIFQEIMLTKLPHYVLPAYPALAFLTADMLVRAIRGQYRDLTKPVWMWVSLGWAILVVLIGFAPWLGPIWFDSLPYGAMVAISLLGIVYGASVYLSFRARRVAWAGAAMGAGMMLVVVVFYGWYVPNAPYLRASVAAAALLQHAGATHPGDVITVDFKEPSLPFYQGGTMRQAGALSYLIDTPAEQWPLWLVLTREGYQQLSAEKQSQLEIVKGFRGFNYAGDMVNLDGKKTRFFELLVTRKKPTAVAAPTTQMLPPPTQVIERQPTTSPTTMPVS